MWSTRDGSTGRLIQLCIGYFVFYVITGVTVKYYTVPADQGLPRMAGIEFLVYSTLGGNVIAIAVVLALRWYRMASNRMVRIGRLSVPSELVYILPSGLCTAVVIPTTTLMYTLPITVMVAMVIMRGSIIVISRAVDAVQIRQGILRKTVYAEENVAVAFALAAVGVHLVTSEGDKRQFEFVTDPAAMTILCSYVAAYAIRIYLMNYFKNTRGAGVRLDNKGFFALEQLSSTAALLVTATVLFNAPSWFGAGGERIALLRGAIAHPLPASPGALVSGMAFGAVAFFSVFIFMFKGRTATFAGLVNRLTSLVAGTAATVVFWLVWSGDAPTVKDWVSLGFILGAVGFLTRAERRRAAELAAAREL
jgi:hypothetical protein